MLPFPPQEMLKARRAGPGGNFQQAGVSRGPGGVATTPGSGAHATTTAAGNNKRYLILTCAAEHGRVHYPLPLSLEQSVRHAWSVPRVDTTPLRRVGVACGVVGYVPELPAESPLAVSRPWSCSGGAFEGRMDSA